MAVVEWGMNATPQKAEAIYAQAAGLTFRIVLHPSVNTYIKRVFRSQLQTFLKGFTVPEKEPDVTFHIHHRTDEFGNERLVKNRRSFFPLKYQENARTIHTFYDLSIFQFRAVFFDCITEHMEKSGRFLLLHAASVRIGKDAHIFLARSGGGKTTITKLLGKHYPVLTEETALLYLAGRRFFLYQLPQLEKDASPPKTPQPHRVAGLYLLEKAKENKLSSLPKKAVSGLIGAGSFQKPNKVLMAKLLKIIPLYTLAFSKYPQKNTEIAKLLLVK